MEKPQRLLALDVLRGITIAGMIVVSNPGSWNHMYAPLKHAAWDGCTPTDLVFPFFVFVMGVAMYLSWRKTDFRLTWRAAGKLLYRGALLVLIGWMRDWYIIMCRTLSHGGTWGDVGYNMIHNMRIMGVLPRLGIVSCLAGLLLLIFKPKRIPWVAALLLVIYCVIVGVTHSFDLTADNVVARVDLAVIGEAHMYHLGGVTFDPEGILSTIPCIAHCLIGVFVGMLITQTDDKWTKTNRLFILGSIILMCGFLLDYAFPINKSMWSISFVGVTCGLASLLLALLIWIIDINGKRRWSVFFESFGANPLFVYVLASLIVKGLMNIYFNYGSDRISVWDFFYSCCMVPVFGENGGSLVCSLAILGLMWLIAYPLYKKKIYIKI